jgi:type II secretory pathway pseudopilin PulG
MRNFTTLLQILLENAVARGSASQPSMRRDQHHAFTIIEVTAAAAILAVILASVVPATLLVQRQRSEALAYRRALEATDNLLERVLALPWDDVRADLDDATIHAREVLADIPVGSWKVSVEDASTGISAKRVTVQVTYGPTGRRGSVRLTGWVYRDPRSGEGA